MLIARERDRAGADRGGALPPPTARPVRPLPARAAARRRAAQRQQHRRGGAAGRRVGASPGRRSAPAPRPSSTAARSCARGSRTRPTTSPASSGSRRPGPSRAAAGWKTSLVFSELGEDHPGALVDALREFSSREVNLTPDRVAAAAPGPRPLHVLLRPRGSARRDGRSRRRSRRCAARPNRCGSWAPTRRWTADLRRIPEQHGTRPRTQRDV